MTIFTKNNIEISLTFYLNSIVEFISRHFMHQTSFEHQSICLKNETHEKKVVKI